MSFVNIQVNRESVLKDGCILGTLTVTAPTNTGPGLKFFRCATLERAWSGNLSYQKWGKQLASCIPAREQAYVGKIRKDLQRDNQGALKKIQRDWRIELQNVEGRKNIQIHWGTTKNSTVGCIIVGMRWDGKEMVVPVAARDMIRAVVEGAGKDPDIRIWIKQNELVTNLVNLLPVY